MRLNTALLAAAVAALLFGLGFLILPVQMLAVYGSTTDAVGVWLARYFGVAMVSLGLLAWVLRGVHVEGVERPVATAFLIGQVIGFLVALWNVLSPEGTPMHWLTVVVYGLLSVAFLWVLLGGPVATPAAHAPR